MTKIKICGLKRKEDIQYVNKLHPEYVGFVFAKSSRQVDQSWTKELIRGLDTSIKKVGVFLNMDRKVVKDISENCSLDVLQFHGNETPLYCSSFDKEVWKAFRIKDATSFNRAKEYTVDGYLIDSHVDGFYGGSGKTFNWNMAENTIKAAPIILAGGLHKDNVKTAMEILKPHILDVSSGVEENGLKNFDKMKKFINTVRRNI